ncbi:MAG: hypothetical protein H6718_21535 [Polyangiaceae bacterium]|nr:hypothetical protein [Polyangiaceae bacterium]
MQRRTAYLVLLVGAWLTLGCNDKAKGGDEIATPDPSAVAKLLETASALPASSGGSAPASSAPAAAPVATEVTFEGLGKALPGPAILKFNATVIEHSKCESGQDGTPCLKYIVVSERSEGPFDKAKDYVVLTPGDPAQYPLGKKHEFSVTVTPKKEIGGKLNDLRLVYASAL